MILIPNKTKDDEDIFQGFYRLFVYPPMAVLEYFSKTYEMDNINVVHTNGHNWVMYELEKDLIKRT